jgi:hypothetical protein
MIDPAELPPELADLFAAERTAPTTTASGRSAIRSRLAVVLVGVPLGAAASVLGGAGKIISIVAIAVAAGGGTIAVVHHASRSSAASAPASRSTDVHPPATHVAQPAVVEATPPPPAEPPAPMTAPMKSSLPTAARTIHHPVASPPPPTEPQLVRDAWTALSANDAARALQIIDQAATLYPAGVLDEERDAVHIVALAKLHRIGDAQAAAARFADQHPTSVHLALIERALHDQDSP